MQHRFWSRVFRLPGWPTVESRGALPPGVDEVRLLQTDDAVVLADLTATLAVLDQALAAMRLLILRRGKIQPDPVADLALLQFALTQFVSCFKARRGPRGLSAKQAFDAAGARHFEHVTALAEQLSGAHARLTGQTEVALMLKRAGARVGMLGLTTRSRPPDRLNVHELSGIADFMERGRDAYAARTRRQRERLVQYAAALTEAELLRLEKPDLY